MKAIGKTFMNGLYFMATYATYAKIKFKQEMLPFTENQKLAGYQIGQPKSSLQRVNISVVHMECISLSRPFANFLSEI